ncbi:MAG: TIGR00153 family protein [Verrucomicrobia bacterium]|nr:TIGR00153 family protein [Verrucomicrobiota bacterium]
MAAIESLFGESPFVQLKKHGEMVHTCVRLVREAFAALEAGELKRLEEIAEQVFDLETKADDLGNRLRERLASRVLLPIRREELCHILEHQDSMADRAEDIVATLTCRDMRLPAELMAEIKPYLERVLKNCELAASVMERLDLLLESSFSGRDALTVSKLITELSEREDATKAVQIQVLRKLMTAEDRLPPVEVILWTQVISFLGELSKSADRTGNGIRMTLQLKREK